MENASENKSEFLIFTLDRETFGIASSFLHEVHPIKEITPLPGVSACIKGLINVRRQIVPVIDLRVLFELPTSQAANQALLIRNKDNEFAILANSLIGVNALSPDDIQPVPAVWTESRRTFLKSITKDGIGLLDGDKLLKMDFYG